MTGCHGEKNMKNIKYILLPICLFVLLTSTASAVTGVNNLHLFWRGGEMVLQTDVSGPFQFSHQIAEAKDGKPFRVLIDIFPAVHNLKQKIFVNLPPSVIKSIRTSQYAVKPETIVRIVCDLKKESVYRIEKKGLSVFLYIPDKGNSDFPRWTCFDTRDKGTKKAVPEPVESKNSRPLVKTPKVKVKSTPGPELRGQPESTYYKPQKSGLMEKEWSQPEPPRQPSKPKHEDKPKTKKPPELTEFAKTDTPAEKADKMKAPSKLKTAVDKKDKRQKPVTQTEEKFEVPSTPMVLIDPSDNPPAQKKTTKPADAPKKEIAQKPEKDQTTKPEKPVDKKKEEIMADKPKVTAIKKTAAVTKKQPEPEVVTKTTVEVAAKPQKAEEKAAKPTSRFRRQPTLPARLKGTIVAEFPTRMVIKYKPGMSRDPFETLIGERRSSNEFGQRKLLEIETARLVGILESVSGKNRALVEDLDGYGYILKQGDRIKKGYVSKIYSDKALFQLFEYGWSRAHALHLDDE